MNIKEMREAFSPCEFLRDEVSDWAGVPVKMTSHGQDATPPCLDTMSHRIRYELKFSTEMVVEHSEFVLINARALVRDKAVRNIHDLIYGKLYRQLRELRGSVNYMSKREVKAALDKILDYEGLK